MVELKAGVKIKTYTLERQLGRGASGEVWKAYDAFKTVAMKFMNENLMTSANAAKHRVRMEREIDAMKKLQHPNIPALYDYDLDFARPYIVMRYVGGDTYDKLIANGEMMRMPLERRFDLIREIAMALTAAHENGIIHRDIKPSNLTGIENPYLLDFSISLEQEEAEGTQQFVGTTLYMSPDGTADRLADNYSFALISYEIIFGRHALWRPTDKIFNQFIAYDRIMAGDWRWPSRIPPNELPADLRGANLNELDRVIARGIGSRDLRYGDLRDFVRDLKAALFPTAERHHDEDEYVATQMLSVADFQEMVKSQPPMPPGKPGTGPLTSRPGTGPLSSAPPPAQPAAAMPAPAMPAPAAPPADHTELEMKTTPYDALANRANHPAASAGAPDRTELEMPAPGRGPSFSGQPGGDKTELEMPAFPSAAPSAPAAPPVMRAAPVPQPAPSYAPPPQQPAQLGQTEAYMPTPVQQPPPAQHMQPMKRIPQQQPPPQPQQGGDAFTMLEMQAPARPQQYGQPAASGESFTMMEMQAVSTGGRTQSQPGSSRKSMHPALRLLLFIGLFIVVALALAGIFALLGVVRFG